jgi:Methyltransferase domain
VLRQNTKLKRPCTFNASRAAGFITWLLTVAGICTAVDINPQQQRTITAALLVGVAVVPTAFAALSVFDMLSGPSRLPGGQLQCEVNLALLRGRDVSELGQNSSRGSGRTDSCLVENATERTTDPPRSPILPPPWTPEGLHHHQLDISRQLPTHDNRNDSAYVCASVGGCSTTTTTESLRSCVLDFPFENGRRYHNYKKGNYFAPNDEQEQMRMDRQSIAMFLASGQKLFYAPIEKLQYVLDLGTGTGLWTMNMGQAYPGASTIGVDLSPIQPEWVFSNVKFEIDDVEEEWTWLENHFDLIYSSLMLSGSIANAPRYMQQAFR